MKSVQRTQGILRYVRAAIALSAICYLSVSLSREYSRETFRGSLLDYVEKHSRKEESRVIAPREPKFFEDVAPEERFHYVDGDWERYIIAQRYKLIIEDINRGTFFIQEEEDVDINSYGSMNLNLKYGKSKFTKNKYKLYDQDKPVSRIIPSGFYPEQELQLHIEGHVGKRLTMYIDHDSRKSDNRYLMKYRAVRDDEVIREINAGEIDIKMHHSKYAVYDDTSSKGLGLDITMRKDRFRFKAFGSVNKGEAVVEYFRGNSSANSIELAEYQYIRNTYFQLEPYKRYDGRSTPPAAADDPYNSLITFTSQPASPTRYIPAAVNIDPSQFELYLDDQNPHNNFNTISLGIDGGSYARMVSGVDYTINYATGLIILLKAIPDNARMFALYTINGGSCNSSDPTARTDVFAGRVFVFIKYGYSIHEDIDRDFLLDPGEDKNGDGKLNCDIYEVRSFYHVGEKQLLEDNFKLQFLRENGILTRDEIARIGKVTVQYSAGLIAFNLREPFRQLLGSSADSIYSERQQSDVYLLSRYKMRVDYYREARSFQLKHVNILPDSVRIKVDSRELPSSLYTLDYTSGFLQFTDPNNPVIKEETHIEVKYEYLPLGGQSQSFIGGMRADYQLSRYVDIGGTLLFSRSSSGDRIPAIGSEPDQILLLEGDTKLHLGEKRLTKMFNDVSGLHIKSVPLEVDAYAEYARSYRTVNTFGKALIDDMESTDEIVTISLSDRDWILSSMPSGLIQNDRGLLYYYYYRDLSNPDTLRGLGFTPYAIPYSSKPGPYNVATGHISDSIQSKSNQRSLVLNYDFMSGNCVSIVTRKLSSEAVDFSSLQYVEIWYRSSGGIGEAELYLDVGMINEDSDGDGILDTEDANNNGFLDTDPAADIFEDRGYRFNPSGGMQTLIGTGPQLSRSTMGDGILNTEDLNGNGMLDGSENSISLPGAITTPYNAANPVIVDLSDESWKKVRIYLDKKTAAYTANPYFYEDVLKRVESVRLFVSKRGVASRGTIFIDSLRFISSRWKNIKLDDVPQDSPTEFRVTIIDTLNDNEYRSESFLFREKETYTALHGDKNDRELEREREAALLIEYNLTARTKGSVTRKFLKPMDLRFYKTLNMWFNFRNYSSGDVIGIRICSSENDYHEYRFPVVDLRIWKEITFQLRKGSGNVKKYATVGNPDMKRINSIELIVFGDVGTMWVNDVYVSDPITQKDSAYWYEGEVKFKRALYYTDAGVPIISDMRIKYIQKGHGAQFSTVGKTVQDTMESYQELFTSMKILPNWSTQFDFIFERSKTDSLNEEVSDSRRGTTNRRTIFFESNYISDINAVPSIKLIYKQEDYENQRDEYLSSSAITRTTRDRTYTPAVVLEERINDVLGGNVVTRVLMDLLFREERVERDAADPNPSLGDDISLEERERRQKSRTNISVDYQNKIFFFSPFVEFSSHEIVELRGKDDLNDTEVLTDVTGGFHVPFVYGDECKFVERNKRMGFQVGLNDIGFVSPRYTMDLHYFENRFRDYDEGEQSIAFQYSRAKDARSYISNRIDFPLRLDRYKHLRFVKDLTVTYSRSVFFQETEIPYEGEGTSELNEQFGIRRTYGGISDGGMNFFKYSPIYFFMGRGNYANGRDYIYEQLNTGLCFPDGSPVVNYNNGLKLIDTFSWSTTLDVDFFMVNLGGGLNQISERQNVYGIPQQVVSLTQNVMLNIDLMEIFRFGFFRPNRIGLPHHSANVNLAYDFTRNMLITSNIEENVHTPSVALTFKRDRSSIGLRGALDYRRRNKREYISLDDSKRSGEDDIYIENMQTLVPFKEVDRGYSFAVIFETDVLWIHRLFSAIYELAAYPIFSIEYSLLLNRYDYSLTVSPEPYDQHLVTGRLTLDLHKNVQGGLQGRWALEKFRNRDTEGVYREIVSYEIGLNFTLLF